MRKIVLWCGAGVIAAVSVGGLTAAYTCRNPESPVGRFVLAAYDLDAAYNPTHRLTASAAHGLAGTVRPTCGAVEPGCGGTATDACVPPAEPKPLEVAVAPSGNDLEVRPECRVPGRIVIEDEAQRPAITVSTGAEESEEPIVVMPPTEDRVIKNRTMPYADEEPAAQSKGFFTSLWEKLTAWCPNSQPTAGGSEECEEHAPTNRHGASDCQEDPNYKNNYSGSTGQTEPPASQPKQKSFFPWMPEKQKQVDSPEPPSHAGESGVEKPFDEVREKDESGTTDFRPSDAKKYGMGRPIPF